MVPLRADPPPMEQRSPACPSPGALPADRHAREFPKVTGRGRDAGGRDRAGVDGHGRGTFALPRGSRRLRLRHPEKARAELVSAPAAMRSPGRGAARGPRGAGALVVNAAQVDEALFGPEGCAARPPRGAVVVSSRHHGARGGARAGARASRRGGLLALDAPVSGGPARAREGALSVWPPALPPPSPPPRRARRDCAKVWRLGEAPASAARSRW